MRFFTAILGCLLVVSLTNAAVVQRRTYRNTEEILVPVTIIQDGEEIKETTADIVDNELQPQLKNIPTEAVAEDIVAAVEEEEKELQAVEAAVEAERRIDEAVVEEEIKEAIQEEQDKEIINAIEEEQKLKSLIQEEPQILALVETEAPGEPQVEPQVEIEKSGDIKSIVVNKQTPNQVSVVIETANNDNEQSEGTVRQATQATPTQGTTQQNFVQQLIQNSPLGQFINQITGQTTNQATANDETSPAAPAPTLPGLFNPVTAVQNAAQTVVNSTTQAFQGLQQFASNLGNQLQTTLTGLQGQNQEVASNDATTARPPGPIQQFVNTIIGNPQQAQPAPTQQGPLQGLLNIFQGNRPAAVTNPEPEQPAKEPETPAQSQPQAQTQTVTVEEAVIVPDQLSNEVRNSEEVNDSFEDSVQPDELIVVNDDASQGENDQTQVIGNVFK